LIDNPRSELSMNKDGRASESAVLRIRTSSGLAASFTGKSATLERKGGERGRGVRRPGPVNSPSPRRHKDEAERETDGLKGLGASKSRPHPEPRRPGIGSSAGEFVSGARSWLPFWPFPFGPLPSLSRKSIISALGRGRGLVHPRQAGHCGGARDESADAEAKGRPSRERGPISRDGLAPPFLLGLFIPVALALRGSFTHRSPTLPCPVDGARAKGTGGRERERER
jgi:hypothetical protein